MGGANIRMKGNDRTASEPSMRSFTLSKTKNLNFSFQNALPEFSSLSWWVLTLVKLSYSRTKKMNLFKMLDFQRIHFSRKRPRKGATPFAQPNCESFEADHQIPSQCPIQRFLTVITHFFWEP